MVVHLLQNQVEKKNIFFEKIFALFTKYALFAKKKCFCMEKKFYIEKFFYRKKTFTEKNMYENVKNIYLI